MNSTNLEENTHIVHSNKIINLINACCFKQKDEIIECVRQGGGFMTDDNQSARYIIQCHGLEADHTLVSHSTSVSSHWIRSCLEVYFFFVFYHELYLCELFKQISSEKTIIGGVHTRYF